MSRSREDLPDPQYVKTSGTWFLPVTRRDEEGTEYLQDVTFEGKFLGFSTTRWEDHRHSAHARGCSACRWSEFRIFRKDSGGYLVHIVGVSALPGEGIRARIHGTDRLLTPLGVISVLVTRQGPTVRMTVPADMVLAQASDHDQDLRDAYENRAVL